VAIPVIGREDLIRNEHSTGRPQDMVDLEVLDRPSPGSS